MKKHTLAKHSFITRFSTDLTLHKLKTDARYLNTVYFYRSLVTLLTPARTTGAGLANPSVVGDVSVGFIS
jgi:hypothetical protein